MFKIALINMPFAALRFPSIALTQLKSILGDRFGERVSVDVLYLNQDFAVHLGNDFYQYVTSTVDAQNTGLGDWLFRQSAFPESPANWQSYFKRYYPYRTPPYEALKQIILEKQRGLEAYMDKVITQYKLDEAAVVGFTSMFTQNTASFALARRIKERNPAAITVMGGANCETPMGEEIVKNVKQIDFVFSGPALKSFPDFIQYQLDNEPAKCHTIKGVYSKKKCAFALLDGKGELGEELDIDTEIKLDYEHFLTTTEKNFPNKEIDTTLLFETSRGCWWGARQHCTFCGLNGATMAYRAMSPAKALKQFEELFKYVPRVKYLESVDNILPKEYLAEVFPKLNTPQQVDLFYEVKADLSEDEMAILSKARVKSIQPGIEALDSSTLKLMRKGTTVFQNIFLMKNCVMHDVYPVWNLLIGFPGEEEEVYKKYLQNIPLITHLPPPTGVFPVRFDRYSPYFMKAKEYELKLQPLDYYELIYPFSRESLTNLAYYFSDSNIGAKYALSASRWIDRIREKTNQWAVAWFADGQVTRPKLHFEGNGNSNVVYDSRSGRANRYQIDETSKKVLECLNKPKRLAVVASELGHVEGLNLEREIAALQQKGLIFHEGERYMNLVLPNDPPRMTKFPTAHG